MAGGLGETIKRTLKDLFTEVADVLTSPLRWGIAWGIEAIMDTIGSGMAKQQTKFLDSIIKRDEVPEETKQIFRAAKKGGGEWQSLLGQSVGSSAIGAASSTFFGVMLRRLTQALERESQIQIPDVTSLVSAWYRGVLGDDALDYFLASQGFNDDFKSMFRKILEPLLPVEALRALELRDEPEFENVQDDLAKSGWTPERIEALKKLYWIIPGVPDLIRMAVREAFSPDIVAKFQTDADFPPEFAEWAEKQGLSAEWAKNYWRAHWDLPSASQGFEMLHRGVIDRSELDVLLRTQDVMPYWRDRLVDIAFSPYTRVDVRRMHAFGVLDREGVKRAYMDIGFDDAKAETMTEFTVAYNAQADRDLTKTDVLTLYRKGVLTETEAIERLVDMDYSEEDAAYLIARESTQVAEEVRELTLTQIKSLALAGIIDKTEATTRLADRGYTAEDIAYLYTLWEMEAAPQDAKPSRTDLERFWEAGIIDLDQWIDGMYKLRYPEEVITWFYLLMTKE